MVGTGEQAADKEYNMIIAILKQFYSLLTDKDWDADGCKIVGIGLIIYGCVLMHQQHPDGFKVVCAGAGILTGRAIGDR